MSVVHERDFIIMAPGYSTRLIFRQFTLSLKWVVYFENEANHIATYCGISETPEEALEKFIKHRINGEYGYSLATSLVVDGDVVTGELNG